MCSVKITRSHKIWTRNHVLRQQHSEPVEEMPPKVGCRFGYVLAGNKGYVIFRWDYNHAEKKSIFSCNVMHGKPKLWGNICISIFGYEIIHSNFCIDLKIDWAHHENLIEIFIYCMKKKRFFQQNKKKLPKQAMKFETSHQINTWNCHLFRCWIVLVGVQSSVITLTVVCFGCFFSSLIPFSICPL